MCGYPLTGGGGDLYGGAHYVQSASATLTPQGRAIREASVRFGDGKTLPFRPCKRGYLPLADRGGRGRRMYACGMHHGRRAERVRREGGRFRGGETDLSGMWERAELELERAERGEGEGEGKGKGVSCPAVHPQRGKRNP